MLFLFINEYYLIIDFIYNYKHMYCFYRVISSVVAVTDIINHLYDKDKLNEVSIVNLNTFAN